MEGNHAWIRNEDCPVDKDTNDCPERCTTWWEYGDKADIGWIKDNKLIVDCGNIL